MHPELCAVARRQATRLPGPIHQAAGPAEGRGARKVPPERRLLVPHGQRPRPDVHHPTGCNCKPSKPGPIERRPDRDRAVRPPEAVPTEADHPPLPIPSEVRYLERNVRPPPAEVLAKAACGDVLALPQRDRLDRHQVGLTPVGGHAHPDLLAISGGRRVDVLRCHGQQSGCDSPHHRNPRAGTCTTDHTTLPPRR